MRRNVDDCVSACVCVAIAFGAYLGTRTFRTFVLVVCEPIIGARVLRRIVAMRTLSMYRLPVAMSPACYLAGLPIPSPNPRCRDEKMPKQ